MKAEELALVQGWGDTRRALGRWNRDPLVVLWPWVRGALAVTAALLATVWLVAALSTPDPGVAPFPGLRSPGGPADFAFLLYRNGLVLALHAMACVAGFMAGSSLPIVAKGYSGLWRRIHDKAGRVAMAFVALATLFSLTTQAYALGMTASSLADAQGVSPGLLLVSLLPHAIPELTALFLPLAAWLLASRRGAWDELLAATFVTTGIAVPVIVAAAGIEVWLTPHVLSFLK